VDKVAGEKNKAEGEAFFAANNAKEGVVTLPSGVQYKILTAGTGPASPAARRSCVDGKTVASQKLPRTIAFRMSLDETLDIGEDTGTPISEDYRLPFKFTGTLEKLTISLADHKLTEAELQAYREGRLKAAMAQ